MNATREQRGTAKLLSVIMALALAMAMVPATALASITASSTASLTVNQLDEGDTVTIYQIITATYDEDSNSITYAFASALENLTYTYDSESKTLDIDTYLALESDSEELAVIVDAITAAILGDSTLAASLTRYSGTVAEEGDSYTFTNVAMGQYLVLVTPGEESTVTKVYKNTTANVLPIVDEDGEYTLADTVTVSVKSTEITPSKTVEEDGEQVEESDAYSVGDTVTYTVVTAVPEYPSNATNVSFEIVDTLGSGLAYVADSVVVKVGSENQTTLTENTDYTVTYDSEKNTLTIALTGAVITTYAGQTLTVTYDVTITEDATTVTDTTTNSVKVVVADPYSSTNGTYETDEDEVELQVYGIYFTKVDASNTSTLLAGAVFDIYRESGNDTSGYDEDDELIGTTEATGSDGVGTFVGLGEGTYYLVEVTAPTGYVLPSGAVATFTISADTQFSNTTDEDGTYYYYVNLNTITNTEQGSLPVTGDMGTTLFIVVGLVLICGAVVLYARSRRKQDDE